MGFLFPFLGELPERRRANHPGRSQPLGLILRLTAPMPSKKSSRLLAFAGRYLSRQASVRRPDKNGPSSGAFCRHELAFMLMPVVPVMPVVMVVPVAPFMSIIPVIPISPVMPVSSVAILVGNKTSTNGYDQHGECHSQHNDSSHRMTPFLRLERNSSKTVLPDAKNPARFAGLPRHDDMKQTHI